jgi:hypothetical protein
VRATSPIPFNEKKSKNLIFPAKANLFSNLNRICLTLDFRVKNVYSNDLLFRSLDGENNATAMAQEK